MATNGAHTHIGAINLVTAFIGVLLIGTLWRLGSMHLQSLNGNGKRIGQAMAVQY